mmetsp:Transcript_20073/g.69663  ORF Transcript_20073/g.69663 Transcript_20073/m.69663 type:complete len:137 (+) Transcript_20073:1026-1436(+)
MDCGVCSLQRRRIHAYETFSQMHASKWRVDLLAKTGPRRALHFMADMFRARLRWALSWVVLGMHRLPSLYIGVAHVLTRLEDNHGQGGVWQFVVVVSRPLRIERFRFLVSAPHAGSLADRQHVSGWALHTTTTVAT